MVYLYRFQVKPKIGKWLIVMLITPEKFGADQEQIRLTLEEENIEARPVWKPMHLQPVFQVEAQSVRCKAPRYDLPEFYFSRPVKQPQQRFHKAGRDAEAQRRKRQGSEEKTGVGGQETGDGRQETEVGGSGVAEVSFDI